MRARPCLQQCGCRVLAAQMKHLEMVWPLYRSRHDEAPTDGASLRLLHGGRWRQTQGACSSLPLAVRVESACCTDEALSGGMAVTIFMITVFMFMSPSSCHRLQVVFIVTTERREEENQTQLQTDCRRLQALGEKVILCRNVSETASRLEYQCQTFPKPRCAKRGFYFLLW